MTRKTTCGCVLFLLAAAGTVRAAADDEGRARIGGDAADKAASTDLPLLHEDGFERGAGLWQPKDSEWDVVETGSGNAYRMTGKSGYKPPVRSPRIVSLLDGLRVTDFELTVRVKSTGRNYGHRDVCLFWGYQDPSHFYYAHLGQKPDPHSCQIFIVNDKPRTRITTNKTEGIPWTEEWHTVKIVRRVSDGTMEVYFDDMTEPIMVAEDKTFTWGEVGLGTFDDSGNWDDFVLKGLEAKR